MSKSMIMKRAWELFRASKVMNFSMALKAAWKEAKLGKKQIKRWFIEKNWNEDEQYALAVAKKISQIEETEKAVELTIESECGTFTKWVPKSCMMERRYA